MVENLLDYVEYLIYAVSIVLAAAKADMVTSYVLFGLLGFSFSFMVSLRQPSATHILLCYPLLCLAHDWSNFYYGLASSVAAALTLYTLKEKLALAPWKLAAALLLSTLAALGISHPALSLIVDSTPVQLVLSHPYGKLITSAGFALALQWLSMQFMLRASTKSFHTVEAVVLSQFIGAYMATALGNLKQSSSNSQAVVQCIAVISWIGFWFFEFFTRSPGSSGVKLTFCSSIAVAISTTLFPVAPKFPPAFVAFFQQDVNYLFLGYWALVFFAFSAIIAFIKDRVSNTAARKGFHFMALAMFLPAMLLDPLFLRTALCLAISTFILVEFIRTSQILGSKVSEMLTRLMNAVTNDRDRAGPWTLSHLYLLIGCGFALLYTPHGSATKSLPIDIMAGPLLVLTIGDSFSSIIGSKWGKHKWKKTDRTVEGTLAGIFSTFASMYALCHFANVTPNLMAMSISIVLTFAIEAYIHALDNLILPVFFFTIYKGLLSV